ncbi:hypothetical protein A1O7_02138 [Cladophialophora yegresii CBS 114405]|uniref:F-box domain-containing protein n=1 Tax=Cladophialophora yegresii CBS 114405 TaxID=1182544 RepID=W9WTQ2_9EURO|nr:uncharacterized protein A1O7_02138 [Cladophialophora yegresii CBS 114405]EXJ61709.1 hypothetical protein A1O7_02138 [Cladophialophora yegresii CBS 114405]
MTLRHAARLYGEPEDDDDNDNENNLVFSSDEDNPVTLHPQVLPDASPAQNTNPNTELDPLRQPPSRFPTAWQSRGESSLFKDATEVPPLHPFQTAFSPETLIAFMREEMDKISRDREASRANGKGKQRETAAPPAMGLPDSTLSSLLPSAPPLSDQSNRGQLASGSGTRRSLRLSQKDSSPLTSLSPIDPPCRVVFPTEPSFQMNDFIPSTRTTTFEEHTKNKRNAVRNNTQESSTSPVRAKLRKPGLSKGATTSDASAAENTGFGGVASGMRDLSDLTLQDDHARLPEHGSPRTGFLARAANIIIRKKVGGNLLGRTLGLSTASIPRGVDNVDTILPEDAIEGDPSTPAGVDEQQRRSRFSFNYAKIIPESIPSKDKKSFLDKIARAKRPQSSDPGHEAQPSSGRSRFRLSSKPNKKEEYAATCAKQYPRLWEPSNTSGIPANPPKPGISRPPQNESVPLSEPAAIWLIDEILWTAISQFLSTQDVKNLRLVSRLHAQILAPVQLRNVVVKFDQNFFNDTIFNTHGPSINRFGVSFEYNLQGLAYASAKIIEKEQDAWFGKFVWPTENYPRFPELQAIEDLVDNNRPLLKQALAKITHASELGLCMDSGHGWIEGPDISDMALFDKRINEGGKVFGKTFKTEDVWTTFARNELFRWGQQNTINTTLKSILARQPAPMSDAKEVRFLDGLKVRDMKSFTCQREQYDFDPECHTGGVATFVDLDPAAAAQPQVDPTDAAMENLLNWHPGAAESHPRALNHAKSANRKLPQWPVIFNGHNLAAEHGGHLSFIQSKIANPFVSPLTPGILSEAQAQWLMETVWAQRAFLGAYTTAIITNKNNFRHVHTLRISKLSSGLLPSLEQQEFWKSLSGLKRLEIYLSPDWHQEHVIGDKAFMHNMPIPPAQAAERFTNFLRRYITKLENLHSLSIGYVGGGEHGVGMYARNQHVLPAPVVDDPDAWLLKHTSKTAPSLLKFDHVRDLKFENCWFTPWMLKGFMEASRDSSLHSLTLDSVSMTTIHEENLEMPLATELHGLRCLHPREDWPRENLPKGAAWARTLDALTPGKPLCEYKYEAGLLDKDDKPVPARCFRGHVQQITLKSCGYVKISLPAGRASTYNQNSAVIQGDCPMDPGLQVRRARFSGLVATSNANADGRLRERVPYVSELHDKTNRIMISSDGFPWLGTLTQCVHPIEKRVLEEAWQMNFGWGDDLSRWAAVEDGMFEGGTGRFSGVIKKDDAAVQSPA